jgi:type IV pilus assembly protein PilC
LPADRSPSAGLESGLRWIPGGRRLLANFHRATFSGLSATLIEHHVPLHDALVLAAEATGDPQLMAGTAHVADDLQSGCSLSQSLHERPLFPPFMQWMLSAGERQGALPAALKQVTEVYRRRALAQSEWFKLVLPLVLVLVIGGGATALYALTLFVPLTELLEALVQEPQS